MLLAIAGSNKSTVLPNIITSAEAEACLFLLGDWNAAIRSAIVCTITAMSSMAVVSVSMSSSMAVNCSERD